MAVPRTGEQAPPPAATGPTGPTGPAPDGSAVATLRRLLRENRAEQRHDAQRAKDLKAEQDDLKRLLKVAEGQR